MSRQDKSYPQAAAAALLVSCWLVSWLTVKNGGMNSHWEVEGGKIDQIFARLTTTVQAPAWGALEWVLVLPTILLQDHEVCGMAWREKISGGHVTSRWQCGCCNS